MVIDMRRFVSQAFPQIIGAARTKILIWYLTILIFGFLVSIPLFQQALFARVDRRVKEDMFEKMATFRAMVEGKIPTQEINGELVNEAEASKDNLRLKSPSNTEELKQFFDSFLSRQVPEDEVYLIAFVNGNFYKSSPRARPSMLDSKSTLMEEWEDILLPSREIQFASNSQAGDLLYLVEPIKRNNQILGVFVVAHTTEGERNEVLEAVSVVIYVLGGMLLVSFILAWIASDQVLAPLRSLIATAKLVRESDLSQRLPVQGTGEMAELAITFNDMMDRLQSAFVSQRDFINDAGHELRTPVTIIRGNLELMGDDPQEQEETIALVLDELDRMASLVDDLSLLTKSERPDFLRGEPVDIQSLTQELFGKARGLAERQWDLVSSAEGTVFIDRYRITQAVMNLAQNAVQHTNNGDRITIGSKIQQPMLHLWVQDTGEGIATVDQAKLFDRFFRVPNSPRRSEGSGLGLSIVKAIVEAHGGHILLQSQLKLGSTFTLVIPLNERSQRSE
jgi:signal transduction histidine kinase